MAKRVLYKPSPFLLRDPQRILCPLRDSFFSLDGAAQLTEATHHPRKRKNRGGGRGFAEDRGGKKD
jgi:hypothetical protein